MPELENGFIQIACGNQDNDILLALAGAGLGGTQLSVCLVVIRKTWGWKKQWDWISLSTFTECTNRSRWMISKTLKELVKEKILLTDKTNPRQPKYKFNKNFREWTVILDKNDKDIEVDSNIDLTSKLDLTDVVSSTLPSMVSSSCPTKETNTKETTKRNTLSTFSRLACDKKKNSDSVICLEEQDHDKQNILHPPQNTIINSCNPPILFDTIYSNRGVIQIWNEYVKYTANIASGDTELTVTGGAENVSEKKRNEIELQKIILSLVVNMIKNWQTNILKNQKKVEFILKNFVLSAEEDLFQKTMEKQNYLISNEQLFKEYIYSIQFLINQKIIWDGNVKGVVSSTNHLLSLMLTGSFLEKKEENINQEICKSCAPFVIAAKQTKLLIPEVKASPTANYKTFIEKFNELFQAKRRVTKNMVAKLQTRMKTFSLEEIMIALENLGKWDFAHGDNDRGWKATPDYLLRNDDQIDRFINFQATTDGKGNKNTETGQKKGYVKPNKRLYVEIILMAELLTGVWDNGVIHVYGQRLTPWLKMKDICPEFDSTSKLLVKFIQEGENKVNDLSWQMIFADYQKYLKTCEDKNVEPRPEIVVKGELLRKEIEES